MRPCGRETELQRSNFVAGSRYHTGGLTARMAVPKFTGPVHLPRYWSRQKSLGAQGGTLHSPHTIDKLRWRSGISRVDLRRRTPDGRKR